MKLIQIFCFLALTSSCKHSSDSNGNKNGADQNPPSNSALFGTKCIVKSSTVNLCYEYRGLPESQIQIAKSSCAQEKGVFKSGVGCPRENRISGCTNGSQLNPPAQYSLVTWYYKPSQLSESTLKGMCESQGESVVPN